MRTLALLLVYCAAAFAQSSFEVASIHVHPASAPVPPGSGNYIHASPDAVTVRYARLWVVIGWAYDVPGQVSGPDWIRSDRWDITAKAGAPTSEAQLRRMLQTLLEERFKLKVHHEVRDLAVAVLSVAKTGSKNLHPVESIGPPEYESTGGMLIVRNASMERLGYYLENRPPNGVSEKIVDETGLKGSFDITLNVRDFDVNDPTFGGDFDEMRRAFFGVVASALEKQYGLKLERRKVPIDCLVVDSGNKVPSPN
jgi:uncharacterized protein (TIGR03435 family)